MKTKLSNGLVHNTPDDLSESLKKLQEAITLWESLTPIARNEFICWIEDAKQVETREKRIKRTIEELLEGKRRPCCWSGCIHRTDKEPSRSQKFINRLDNDV